MVYFHPSAVAIVSHDQMKIIKSIRPERADMLPMRSLPISIFSILSSPSFDTAFLLRCAQVAPIIKITTGILLKCAVWMWSWNFEKVVHHCAFLWHHLKTFEKEIGVTESEPTWAGYVSSWPSRPPSPPAFASSSFRSSVSFDASKKRAREELSFHSLFISTKFQSLNYML